MALARDVKGAVQSRRDSATASSPNVGVLCAPERLARRADSADRGEKTGAVIATTASGAYLHLFRKWASGMYETK